MARGENVPDQIKDEVVRRLFCGEALAKICDAIPIPRMTLWNAMKADPAFEHRVKEARESFCFDLADRLVDMADHAETMVDVQRLRLKAENIRFVVSKLAPKTFGDQIQVNVNATLDISAALNAAAGRVAHLLHTESQTIDVSPLKTEQLTTGLEPVVGKLEDLL